ncbi:MAG: ParA family protein [Syntrophomonadaceae bacterium]|nr:ParA family protein [Syntrophomonadaceae bacterium]
MVITVINNKGGTGKTTISVNLAASVARSGYNVLLIDLDSQASAAFYLGLSREELEPSLADVLFNELPITEAIRETDIPGLDIVPGGIELAHSDLILADVAGREDCLLKAIKPVKNHYDFIICDCSPSISTLSVNALIASDTYLVPITPQYLSLEGLVSLMEAVDKIKTGMGLNANLLGIVINMVSTASQQTRSQANIIGLVREHYQKAVFTNFIKRYAKLEEAPAHGCSIFEYAPKSPAALQYNMLAQEVLSRCGMEDKAV